MRRLSVCVWLLPGFLQASFAQVDYSQYVNPLIGGSGPFEGLAFGGGDIFVGGAQPLGVVKLGIDTYEPNVSFATINGGWTPKGYVTGISMMHESGTGGEPKYGIISQMPLTTVDAPVNILDNTTYWQTRLGNDTARVGYLQARLESGVTVELSGPRHSGILQYSFPEGEKHVLVDVSHHLPDELGSYSTQVFLGGEISTAGSQYNGYGTYGGGWNNGAPYTVYFCGAFDVEPDQARTFRGRNTDPIQRYHTFSNEPYGQPVFSSNHSSPERSGPLNDRVGAVFSWVAEASPAHIKSKVGISFISVEKACHFKDKEIPSWSIQNTVDAAVKEWNDDVFSRIQVPTDDASSNKTNLVLLHSSLYFTHLMPSDRTGENPLWDSHGEPSWDDFYTLWDTFRCTTSLHHLLQPDAYGSQVRSLIDIWRHEGYMPDGRAGNYNGLVQGGSNADNVLADAYVKGLRGSIDWTAGYRAMVKDAEATPYNMYSFIDLTASVNEGRGALDDWIGLGYVSLDNTRCISRTVEYALNDYALSVVAAGEAPQDVEKYRNRSAGWQRSWNHNVTNRGFDGFLTPRYADGSWNASGYDPGLCGECCCVYHVFDCGLYRYFVPPTTVNKCEWDSISYEVTPWEYSFNVPHDMETLIRFMGGETEFERRLDYIFQPNTSEQSQGSNGAGITTIMNIGNEPDFATPYLYNYLNKQHKSVNQSRALANQYFHNVFYGVPGNSDAGALNSWLIWQMIGLYPIVTQPVYLLESPWFSDINMTVNRNATLRITSTGDSHSLVQKGYYVRSVRINGRARDRNWLSHDDVMIHGGTIEFDVGDEPVVWETGDAPPSPGHGELDDI